jgi:hypothetical protein
MDREISPHSIPPVSYATPGVECPPHTSVSIRRDSNGIWFVDDPKGTSKNYRRSFALILGRLAFGLAVLVSIVLTFHLPRYVSVVLVSFFSALGIWSDVTWLWAASRHPTVIGIAGDSFAITLPNRNQIAMKIGDVSAIRATRPRSLYVMPGRVSSLAISAHHRHFRLLRHRDYVEVRWLAHQLRAAVGLPVEDPREPGVSAADDIQQLTESTGDWTGVVPAIPASPVQPPSNWWDKFWRDVDRESFGCLTSMLLWPAVVAGWFGIVRLTGCLVICLQFGRDAYLHHGLRFKPHGGTFQLTNGQTIAPRYTLLFFVFYFVLTPLYVMAALRIAIAFNRLVAPYTRRRLKAKMDRIWLEKLRANAKDGRR